MVQQNVVVKTYTGSQERATKLFQEDSVAMAENGYFPTSQSYAPGTYGCGAFLFALLLCFILIGILIFIYMLLVKPDGVLSVTYEYRGIAAKAAEEKTCPYCAETIKAAATICRFCQKELPSVAAQVAPQVAPPSDAQLMSEFGITFDGERYCYESYRYDKLADAVAYAKSQAARCS